MFGLFKKKKSPPPVFPVVDLGRYTLDDLKLGEPMPECSPYREHLVPSKIVDGQLDYDNDEHGVFISTVKGVINCFFLNLADFQGTLLYNGQGTNLRYLSSEADVIQLMGEPYWRDVDGDEILSFYEFDSGRVEIQFEYPESNQLDVISILSPGILAEEKTRKSYKVTKPWPPSN